jgi:hypothetical protein
MAFNRELSQFASFLELDASARYIGITSNSASTKVGIGTALPDSKFVVVGDARITGIVTAANFKVSEEGRFEGPLTGNVTGNVTGNLTGEVNAASFDTNTSGVVVTGVATATSFSGALTGNVTGNLTGNADTATTLQTSRTISLTGDVAGSVSFDGSSNVSIAATIQPNSVALGGDTTGNYVATVADAGSSDIVVSGSGSETAAVTLGLSTTGVAAGSYGSSTSIPTFTVDSRGRLTAAGTAPVGTALTVAGDSGSETINLLSETLTITGGTNLTSSAASNAVTVNLDPNISLTSVVASGIVTAAQFVTGASGQAIGISTNVISGPDVITIDPAAVGDNTGAVRIKGDLYVDGAQFFVNSGTIELADFIVGVATTASTNAVLDGAGIGIGSANVRKTLTWNNTSNSLKSSENLDLASGKSYKINGTEVLSANSLTITNVNASGIVSATTFVGALTGNSSTASALQTARTISITGDVAGSVSFDGSSNVSIAATIQPNSVTLGSDTTGNYVATVADSGSSDIVVNNSGSETAAVTLGLTTTGVVAGSYGSTTAIPTFTVDSRGRLTSVGTALVGTALTVAGDSGSETINLLTETLTVSGGTNLTSSASGNTVTVNLDPSIDLTSVKATGIITAAQFVTGASGQAIGINSSTISGPAEIIIDPAGVGDNTGAVRIKGDLFVDGVQTVINSTTIELADFIVGIASTATTDALADGAGIKIGPNNTLTYDNANTALKSSENFNLASGKTYKINGVDVLSATSLSITNVNASGVVTATSGFSGNLTGNVTGNVTGNLTGEVNAAAFDTNASGVVVTGVTTSTSFSGPLTGNVTGNVTGNLTGEVNAAAFDTNASGVVVSGVSTLGITTFTGAVSFGTSAYFGDNDTLNFGDSNDLRIYHDGSNSFIQDLGTGGLYLAGSSVISLQSAAGESKLVATTDGAVELYFNNVKEFETTGYGATVFGTLQSQQINVSGVTTSTGGFSGNLTGNVTGNLNSTGVSTASFLQATTVNVSAAATIPTLSGTIATFTNITANGGLNGNINTSGIGTIATLKATTATVGAGLTVSGLITGSAGATITGGETTLSSATVSDLTAGRVVLAGTSGSLEDNSNLTFSSGAGLRVTGGANVSAASTFGGNLNVGGNVVVTGDLTVNGTTTQINTVTMTVEDTLLELQVIDGSAPASDTNKDVGIVMNYFTSSAKKAAFYWDDSVSRMVAASDVSESSGVLTASTFAGLEIGSLFLNDCAGASQVISCSGTTRSLENITIDGGLF